MLTLDLVAQRYHQRPSDLVDPDHEWVDGIRFQFDLAVAVVGSAEQAKQLEESDASRPVRRQDRPPVLDFTGDTESGLKPSPFTEKDYIPATEEEIERGLAAMYGNPANAHMFGR